MCHRCWGRAQPRGRNLAGGGRLVVVTAHRPVLLPIRRGNEVSDSKFRASGPLPSPRARFLHVARMGRERYPGCCRGVTRGLCVSRTSERTDLGFTRDRHFRIACASEDPGPKGRKNALVRKTRRRCATLALGPGSRSARLRLATFARDTRVRSGLACPGRARAARADPGPICGRPPACKSCGSERIGSLAIICPAC